VDKVLVVFDPPPPYGGVRVSSMYTFNSLSKNDDVIYEGFLFDTYPGSLVSMVLGYVNAIRGSDAVLFQIGDVLTLLRRRGKLLFLVAFLMRKPIFYRGFAGGLEQQFNQLSLASSLLLKLIITKCSMLTFQTKADYLFFSNYLSDNKIEVKWFPNVRSMQTVRDIGGNRAKRFCFIGAVNRDKGAYRILKLNSMLPPNVTIDIYGAIDTDDTELNRILSQIGNNSQVRYRGELNPDCIVNSIKEYDCLLLPTIWRTEGHPGVILEAFSVAVPVIATRWNGIPELVDDSCGILIEPNSDSELLHAIQTMYEDQTMWNKMRSGAQDKLKAFDPEIWNSKLHHWIVEALQ